MRIIGGCWRGTRIAVDDAAGLRPSPDRTRETLFNWLAPTLPGARCLDLFAGSGVLGFEAVSRGAADCDLVEANPRLVARLEAVRQRLDARNVNIHAADALRWLEIARPAYDIVFLDPPFSSGLLAPVLARLLARGLMAPAGLAYVEVARDAALRHAGWSVVKEGRTRATRYGLLEPTPAAGSTELPT